MSHTSSAFEALARKCRGALRLPSVIAPILMCLSAGAAAQSWDYSQSSSPLTSLPVAIITPNGLLPSLGLATDSRGDVFLTSTPANNLKSADLMVYEVVAENGSIGPESQVIAVDLNFSVIGSKGVVVRPQGIAVDSNGNVYVAARNDSQGAVYEIQATNGQIAASSTITSLGTGWQSPVAVAIDAKDNVFVADPGTGSVKELSWVTGGGGIVHTKVLITRQVGPGFNTPDGLTFDGSGNLYVASEGAGNVYKVTPVNGAFSSSSPAVPVAQGLYSPGPLTFDGSGNLFVLMFCNSKTCEDGGVSATALEEIGAVNGSVGTTSPVIPVAQDLWDSIGLALEPNGRILVLNEGLAEIVPAAANFGATAVGQQSQVMMIPFHFTLPGSLKGWKVLSGGKVGSDFQEAPTGTTCSTTSSYAARDSCSVAVQFDPQRPGARAGAVLFDVNGPAVLGHTISSVSEVFLHGTGTAPQVAFPGSGTKIVLASGLNQPRGIAVDQNGNIFVANAGDNTVRELPPTGQMTTFSGNFISPQTIAVDGSGNVYVVDGGNGDAVDSGAGEVYEIPLANAQAGLSTAPVQISSDPGAEQPVLALDADGNAYLYSWWPASGPDPLESGFGEIFVIGAPDGQVLTADKFQLPLEFGIQGLVAMAVDGSGDLFVASAATHSVQKIVAVNGRVSTNSSIVTVVADLNQPTGLAVDAAGDLYIADASNGTITEVMATAGVVDVNSMTITLATGFQKPSGVALDASGNLYVTDAAANTVTELFLSQAATQLFPTPTAAGQLDAADGPRTVTVSNNGNESLTFAVPNSGLNPSVSASFTWDSASTCSQNDAGAMVAFQLAPGSTCTIAVIFAPAAAGTIEGSIAVSDNALDAAKPHVSKQIIPLSGAGIGDTQTINFSPIAGPAPAGSTIALSATATSGLAVRFSSNTPSVCTVSGSKASLLIAGTCTVLATQPGNDEYLAATPVSRSVAVVRDSQSIRFAKVSSTAVALKSINLSATATSGLMVSFKSTTPKVCNIEGSKAKLLIAGTCTIEAAQGGNSIFGPAKTVSQSFTVLHAGQQISFPSITTTEHAGETIALRATANSELRVGFTSKTPRVCEVNGAEARLLMAGTCTIEATQSGNATYAAATSIIRSFSVGTAK